MQYNLNKFFATSLEELGFKHYQQVLLMGYTDNYLPQVFRLSSNTYSKGKFETWWTVAGGVRSVKELIHVLKLQTQEYTEAMHQQRQNFDQQKHNQWSSQNIASVLDLEAYEREQLEGAFMAGFNAPLGIVTFDNRTIEQLTKGKFKKR